MIERLFDGVKGFPLIHRRRSERCRLSSKLQVEQLDKLDELTGAAGTAGPEDEELGELMKRFYQAAVQVCALLLACAHLRRLERFRKRDALRCKQSGVDMD